MNTFNSFKPEVYGALSLACKYCKEPQGRTRYERKKNHQKNMKKVQKHIARAIKYQGD